MVEVSGSRDGGLALRPFGELGHFQLGPLRAAFAGALQIAESIIRVNLGEVTLLSSSAVAFLEAAAVECELRELRFELVDVVGLNRRVVDALGAGRLVAGSTRVPVR